jgi:DNA primase
LGYAPRGTAFLDAMKGMGLREDVLLEAGLIVKREDGTLVPRFRGRLLFPIHDLRSRVVGFSGRLLGAGEPKYLNSPDTPIFHKGKLLYNLHVAKHAMRKAERAILVEGQFDALRLTLAGFEEVVAPLGTGLSEDQAVLLQRHAPHVILLYDSDDAGLRATFRAGDELLRHKVRVSVATLPEGEDPDTLVQQGGAAALEGILKQAIDVLERKIQILERKGFFGTLPGRRRALDALLPTIRAATDPIARDLYLSRVAEAAGIRKETLEEEVAGRMEAPRPHAVQATVVEQFGPAAQTEKSLLLVMLHSPEWKARVLADVDRENFSSPRYRTVFDALAEDAPDRLDEISARTLEDLQATGLGVVTADDLFAWAINSIEADRKSREITRLQREIDIASETDKERLTLEKRALTDERNAKRPTWKILETARRKGAPGT